MQVGHTCLCLALTKLVIFIGTDLNLHVVGNECHIITVQRYLRIPQKGTVANPSKQAARNRTSAKLGCGPHALTIASNISGVRGSFLTTG